MLNENNPDMVFILGVLDFFHSQTGSLLNLTISPFAFLLFAINALFTKQFTGLFCSAEQISAYLNIIKYKEKRYIIKESFIGQVVLVTGAAQGIELSTAQKFASRNVKRYSKRQNG